MAPGYERSAERTQSDTGHGRGLDTRIAVQSADEAGGCQASRDRLDSGEDGEEVMWNGSTLWGLQGT